MSDEAPAELNHAGAVVDQAIDYMTKQGMPSIVVASALLAGAVAMLGRALDPEGVARVLTRAADDARAVDETGRVGH